MNTTFELKAVEYPVDINEWSASVPYKNWDDEKGAWLEHPAAVDRGLKAMECLIRIDTNVFWNSNHPDSNANDLGETRICRVTNDKHILYVDRDKMESIISNVCHYYGIGESIGESIENAHDFGATDLLPDAVNQRDVGSGKPLVVWSPLVHQYMFWGLSLGQSRVKVREDAGKGLSEIADELGITKGTVKSHRQRIREKERKDTTKHEDDSDFVMEENIGLGTPEMKNFIDDVPVLHAETDTIKI